MAQNNMFFIENYTSFDSKHLDTNLVPIPLEEPVHFGILKLDAISCDVTQEPQEFVFTVDNSGSMSDICSDGRTKMQHICHTLKNMIIYFNNNPNINLHITVFSFDDNFQTVLERTQITEDNLQTILLKIDKIHPSGSTDIENALKMSDEYIQKMRTECPSNVISHIFMTDGEATSGSRDKDILKNLVDSNISTAFIGFGVNHDAFLLNYISNSKNISYHFIDLLEKAGLVYGEILHNALYKHLSEVTIQVDDGFIYDYKNNNWVSQLFVGDIVSEASKIYHIVSSNPDTCEVVTEFTHLGEQHRVVSNKLCDPNSDHTKYIYRQRTLEFLFKANEFQVKQNDAGHTSWNYLEVTDIFKKDNESKKQEQIFKTQLRDFIEEMKKYITDNGLTDDKFIKNLCDDIYISYRTFGTRYGNMYSCARQTSQGTQRCYTATNIPDDNIRAFNTGPPLLRRHVTNYFDCVQDDDDMLSPLDGENILEHDVSNFCETPYLTPTAERLMRECSAGRNDKHDDNKEDIEETQAY